MKALLIVGGLLLAACTTATVEPVDAEIMLPVRGLCNTLAQSRQIMTLPYGPESLALHNRLTTQGECFRRVPLPVSQVCLADTRTFAARLGHTFNTYRFTSPSGTERYGAARARSRLDSSAAAASTGMCGGEKA